MNIFFNSSTNDTSCKVASSSDIPNITNTLSSDYSHYIDFTIPLIDNKKILKIIDKNLLACIYKYKCNSIILNEINNTTNQHVILKFTTLLDLLNFSIYINIPITIKSIRTIHNSIIEKINIPSDTTDEPNDPDLDDPDLDDPDHDDPDDPDLDDPDLNSMILMTNSRWSR